MQIFFRKRGKHRSSHLKMLKEKKKKKKKKKRILGSLGKNLSNFLEDYKIIFE